MAIKTIFQPVDNNNYSLSIHLIIKEMKKLVAQIKEELDAFVVNADAQVEKGNKAAGARARKAALELMKDLKEFRKVSVAETKK